MPPKRDGPLRLRGGVGFAWRAVGAIAFEAALGRCGRGKLPGLRGLLKEGLSGLSAKVTSCGRDGGGRSLSAAWCELATWGRESPKSRRGGRLSLSRLKAGLPAKPSRLRPKVPGLEKVLRGRSVLESPAAVVVGARGEFAAGRTGVAGTFAAAEGWAIALEGRAIAAEAWLAAEAGFVAEGRFGTEGGTLPCPVEGGFAVVRGLAVVGAGGLRRSCVCVVLHVGGRLRGGEAVGLFFFPGFGEAGAIGAVGFAGEGAAFARGGAVF